MSVVNSSTSLLYGAPTTPSSVTLVSASINTIVHGELGYWLGVPFWNQGYCTEAALAVVQYGFEVLRLHRIYASHMIRNPASGRIMQKIGMTYEGCQRQHVQKWGVFEDLATYGILQSEYVA